MVFPFLQESKKSTSLHLLHPEAEKSRVLRQCSWLLQWLAQQARADSQQLREQSTQIRAVATQVYTTAAQQTSPEPVRGNAIAMPTDTPLSIRGTHSATSMGV